MKIKINQNYKVSADIRHFLGMEFTIENYWDDLLNNNDFLKEGYRYLKACGRRPEIVYKSC